MAGKAGRSGGALRRTNESHRKTGTLRADQHGINQSDKPRSLVEPLEGGISPMRPLGPFGLRFFNDAIDAASWLGTTDIEVLTMAGELVDERTAKRVLVMSGKGNWRDEIGLRKLDVLMLDILRELSLTPISRSRGALGEVAKILENSATLHVLNADSSTPIGKDIVVSAEGQVSVDGLGDDDDGS